MRGSVALALISILADLIVGLRRQSKSVGEHTLYPKQCFWNNATEQCTAFTFARPSVAPDSMCTPKHVRNFWMNSLFDDSLSGLSQAECESRTGKNGLPCVWGKKPLASVWRSDCQEDTCSLHSHSDECDGLCEKDGNFCKLKKCGTHTSESECSDAVNRCNWSGSQCEEVHCASFQDAGSCADGSSTMTLEDTADKDAKKCWWDDSMGSCRESQGCRFYPSETACAADTAKWGNCLWQDRGDRAFCNTVHVCNDYHTQSVCNADPFGTGASVLSQCSWQELPRRLNVGSVLHIRGSWGRSFKTSGNLKVNPEHHALGLLNTFGRTEDTLLLIAMRKELGYHEDWMSISLPVAKVTDQDGMNVPLSEVPTPIPDSYELTWEACRDQHPVRAKEDADVKNACNHHDEATCATATTLFPCPLYCLSQACRLTTCRQSCTKCQT